MAVPAALSTPIEWDTDVTKYGEMKDGVQVTSTTAIRNKTEYPYVSFKVSAKRPLSETVTHWSVTLNHLAKGEAELGLDSPTRQQSIDWSLGYSFWTLKGEAMQRFRVWSPAKPLPDQWSTVEFSADLKTNTLYCAVDGIPVGILETGFKDLGSYHPCICFRGFASTSSLNYNPTATLLSSLNPITPTIRDTPIPASIPVKLIKTYIVASSSK